MYKNRDDNFGNGRDVRNRFEDIISRQANRLAAMEAPTKDDLMTITKEDFLVSADGINPDKTGCQSAARFDLSVFCRRIRLFYVGSAEQIVGACTVILG